MADVLGDVGDPRDLGMERIAGVGDFVVQFATTSTAWRRRT
jgi:hypothetical protein